MVRELPAHLRMVRVDHDRPSTSSARGTQADPLPTGADVQSLRERQTVLMTVLAQDPQVRDAAGRPVTAQVAVPADRLEPGPRSHRFHVVDVDTSTGAFHPPAVLTKTADTWSYVDRFSSVATQDLENPAWQAQNVFAIAARVLSLFERYLGRRVRWGFDDAQLFLIPNGFVDANAYYSREDQAIFFGYLPPDEDRPTAVHSCLSHDIVAHEVTHAILDGMRPSFVEPGLPDQLAYHEALGDIVAFLSVLSTAPLLEAILTATLGTRRGRVSSTDLTADSLRTSVLFHLADELGKAVDTRRSQALRRSLETVTEGGAWRARPAYLRPHRRGEVLVAAVLTSYVTMWDERLRPYRESPSIELDRVADEGARTAEHLLGMIVRATDYLPPVELEFEDVVDAILTADEVVAPDDAHHYRDAVIDGFARFDIHRPPQQGLIVADLDEPPVYASLNRLMLQSSRDEVFRFIWQNPKLLNIDLRFHLAVDRVLATRRTGPDGLTVDEVLADYTQSISLTAEDLPSVGLVPPPGLAAETPVKLLGGGVLIFDQFGRLRVQVDKPLLDIERQQRRIDYLVANGLADSMGRFGFTYLTPRGQRFANLHDPVSPEAW